MYEFILEYDSTSICCCYSHGIVWVMVLYTTRLKVTEILVGNSRHGKSTQGQSSVDDTHIQNIY